MNTIKNNDDDESSDAIDLHGFSFTISRQLVLDYTHSSSCDVTMTLHSGRNLDLAYLLPPGSVQLAPHPIGTATLKWNVKQSRLTVP